MKKKIISLYTKNKKFIIDNSFLFAGFFFAGVFSYFYHFIAGRFLGPEDYSIIGSLFSIIYLGQVFVFSIQLGVTKYVSELEQKNEQTKINYLLKKTFKDMTIIGGLCGVGFILLSPLLGSFLKINNLMYIVPVGIYLLLAFQLPVGRGALQGLQKFKILGLSYIFEAMSKVLVAIILITLGLGVAGAISAVPISYIIAISLLIFPLSYVLKGKTKKIDIKGMYKYMIPTFLALFSLTLMYSIDVLLVKHYFTGVEAGMYSAASTISKIIYFASYSVAFVMFPKLNVKLPRKDNIKTLHKSLLLACTVSLPFLAIYILFPKLIVTMLFGEAYISVANIIGIFGIFITLYTLVYLLAFYNLSLKKMKFLYFLFIGNIVQIGMIMLFHSSLLQILQVSTGVVAVLFIILLLKTEIKFLHKY